MTKSEEFNPPEPYAVIHWKCRSCDTTGYGPGYGDETLVQIREDVERRHACPKRIPKQNIDITIKTPWQVSP